MSVKINSLEIENVKRIKALRLEPSAAGLTIIGGNNNQGKTSVLDAIAWALGGEKFKPTSAEREGAYTDPVLHVELSNGLIVERKGKNSSLKVIDKNGNKSGQQLLNSFVSQFALDLPRFMDASAKEKAEVLLQIIGVGDKLTRIEQEEQQLYNQRTVIGRIAEQKQKYASELTCWENVPDVPVSALELIQRQQDILARNGENNRKRMQLDSLRRELSSVNQEKQALLEKLAEVQNKVATLEKDIAIAEKTVVELRDESTSEIERSITEIDNLNAKIRDNLNKEKAEEEAKNHYSEYNALTEKITALRQEKQALLMSADLPLPGLSVESGNLLYNGRQWDSMSGSDQLRVATAIVRKLNPQCGFVLVDKLEQMDMRTLTDYGAWLEAEGLQAIATRVSTGDECSIIIEDGYSAAPKTKAEIPAWQKGVF